MGARGPLAKPAGQRQGHRGDSALVVIPGGQEKPVLPPPDPPAGLRAYALERWQDFWDSSVAKAVDRSADLGRLHRWIEAVNELRTLQRAIRTKRVVSGSMGQPVLNPLIAYAKDLEAVIAKAEQEFGMTPYSRARLGLTEGQARLTAAELNAMLRTRPADDTDLQEFGDEFTE